MTESSSSYGLYVDVAFWAITGLAFLILLGIVIAMVYFVIKYSRKKNPHPKNIEGNITLEIVWTVIPLVLVVGMFYYGWVGYVAMRDVPENAIDVKAIGKMWQWSFEYPNGVTTDTLFAPAHTPVKVAVTSLDVNHSLFIPAFRIKRDAIPGKRNTMWFNATREGSFDVACAEYCGLNHSAMYTKVVVQDSASFEKWYEMTSTAQGKPYTPLLSSASDTTQTSPQ